MPILNYTTKISTEKTAGEIQSALAKAGAQAILCEYGPNAVMCAMSFQIMTPHGLITFRLTCNTEGVLRALEDAPRAQKTQEQAARVAWRIMKDWIEAQLAIIEAGLADMAQVFLPYAQDASGMTVYERLNGQGFKQLTETTRMTRRTMHQ